MTLKRNRKSFTSVDVIYFEFGNNSNKKGLASGFVGTASKSAVCCGGKLKICRQALQQSRYIFYTQYQRQVGVYDRVVIFGACNI